MLTCAWYVFIHIEISPRRGGWLEMFENKVLRRIFRLKREEEIG
jgi:hypothetical protein